MKKLFTILFLFVSFIALSQNNGINFQGVGRNSSGAVLASTKISLRFSVIQSSEAGTVEYAESKEVTTNAQGIFSVVIGDGTQISKTGNFSDINWKINPKFLKVEMDPSGGTSFVATGTTRLQAVPFAYYANGVNADNVDGVLSASKGGTGVASISALKTALAIDQINNTSDLAKPISTATQAALDTKVSSSTFSTTIATKAPIDSPTFTGTVAGITKAMVGLGSVDNTSDLAKPISTLTQEALETKVSNATFSTTVATKANATDLALKAPIESPTFTGTVAGITKAMVGLGSVNNTADLAKPISTATQEALDTKVSASTFSTTLATKVSTETFSSTVATKENAANKSTATDLGASETSDILFPTQKAVKTYVDGLVNSGGVQDGGILTRHIADLTVTNAKVATGIDKAKVGLENVDNTSDALKPISTATQEALDTKLYTEDFNSRLRNIAKLDEANYFTGEQNIFNGNQTVIGELTLPNGILNLSTGTQILSGTNSNTTIQNRADSDFSIKTSADQFEGIEYGESDPREHELKFTADGKLRFSDGSRIFPYLSDQDFESEELKNVFSIRSKTGGYIELKTSSNEEEYGNYWTFKDNGTLVFPNSTKIETGTASETIIRNTSDRNLSIVTKETNDDGITEHEFTFGKDGYIIFDQVTGIGRENGEFNLLNEGNINLISNGNIVLGDPNEMGRSFKFEIDNSVLKFPQGSAEIYSSDDGYFGMQAKLDGIFEIFTRNSGDDFEIEEDDIYNFWEFQSNGILEFPDGTEMGSYYSNGPPIFKLSSSSGFYIVSGEPDEERNLGAGILISPDDAKGEMRILTREYIENVGEISNSWSYDSHGKLTFPDGTTLAANYSGSSDFEIETQNKAFSIRTVNDNLQNIFEWNFEQNGSLNLPILETAPSNVNLQEGSIAIAQPSGWDPLSKGGSVSYPVFYNGTDWVGLGSSVATGSSTPTNILYVDPSLNTNYNTILANENGFKFQFYQDGVGLDKQWSYNMDGSLTFPDGTITSGNISGTSNFGFDTRPTENGFTILTGTSSGTSQLWTFGTDGNLTLPQGGEIKDQNGNSVLMRFLSIEHIPDQNTIDAINAITVGNNQPRNTLEQNNGVINGYTITLNHLPISIDHVALYLNGVRVYKSQYSLSNGQIIYYAYRRQNQNDSNYLEMMLSNDDTITIDYFY
jgi:hypothetical protein